MKILFVVIILFVSDAHSLTTFSKKPKTRTDLVKTSQSAIVKQDNSKLKDELEFYKKRSKSLELMKKYKVSRPDIVDSSVMYREGDLVGGHLRFSVLSTNIDSPIIITPEESADLPAGAKFLCSGATKHKRVMANCYKLVLPDEIIEISASVLSEDGSSGVRGHYFSGKEEYIAGMIVSEATKGLLAVQQTTVNTAIGPVTGNTSKNALLQAMINSADKSSDLMREEMQTKEPKVFVKRGTRVVLFINQFGRS